MPPDISAFSNVRAVLRAWWLLLLWLITRTCSSVGSSQRDNPPPTELLAAGTE